MALIAKNRTKTKTENINLNPKIEPNKPKAGKSCRTMYCTAEEYERMNQIQENLNASSFSDAIRLAMFSFDDLLEMIGGMEQVQIEMKKGYNVTRAIFNLIKQSDNN